MANGKTKMVTMSDEELVEQVADLDNPQHEGTVPDDSDNDDPPETNEVAVQPRVVDNLELARQRMEMHRDHTSADMSVYEDRVKLLEADIEENEAEKDKAANNIKGWQTVHEHHVNVGKQLEIRKAAAEAALNALRRSGVS